jgi:PAS domain-containing protein
MAARSPAAAAASNHSSSQNRAAGAVSSYNGVRRPFRVSHGVTDEHVTDAQMKLRVAEKIAALHTEAGLRTVLDGIGEGFYAVDRDWRLILFNGEAAAHFRCPPESVLGRLLWEAFPGTRDTALGQLFLPASLGNSRTSAAFTSTAGVILEQDIHPAVRSVTRAASEQK